VKTRDIDRFFGALARAWPHPTDILLIGGAAAVLDGSTRPTFDVDFEVAFGEPGSSEDGELFAAALHQAEAASGVEGQFTEDIGAWSPITLPPWRRSARPWKRFGPIKVRLLDSAFYAVSKLRRGNTSDFDDLMLVARRHRLGWRSLAILCGQAVRHSPSSTELRGFVRRVEYLFQKHGRTIWGTRFDARPAVDLFRRRSAGRALRRS